MKKIQPKKNYWMLWRKRGDKYIFKSYIQDIMPTIFGKLIETSDRDNWTNYPNRILEKEIIIIKIHK